MLGARGSRWRQSLSHKAQQSCALRSTSTAQRNIRRCTTFSVPIHTPSGQPLNMARSSLHNAVRKRIDKVIMATYPEAYEEAQCCCDGDRLDEGTRQCGNTLPEVPLPYYVHMSTIILLRLMRLGLALKKALRSTSSRTISRLRRRHRTER